MAFNALSNARLLDIFHQLDAMPASQRRYSKIQDAYDRVCDELERRGLIAAIVTTA